VLHYLAPLIAITDRDQLLMMSRSSIIFLSDRGKPYALESFLSKVAFKSNLRKKLARKEHVLIVKVSFEIRKIAKGFMTHVQDFF